jgi:aquaporin TIP
MAKIALGTSQEDTKPDCIQALIVEFIVTFLYVFAGVGSAMAARMYLLAIYSNHVLIDENYQPILSITNLC